MRIYVLGSNHFMKEMVAVTDKLQSLKYDAWIHPHYIDYVRGEMKGQVERLLSGKPGESAAIKRANDYIRQHYKHILESDAILIVNAEKKGIRNYIGGNVLMEISQAYVNDKKIYFLYGMPESSPYLDEIEAMDPICLRGNLEALPK